jgi:hypothetical protein
MNVPTAVFGMLPWPQVRPVRNNAGATTAMVVAPISW